MKRKVKTVNYVVGANFNVLITCTHIIVENDDMGKDQQLRLARYCTKNSNVHNNNYSSPMCNNTKQHCGQSQKNIRDAHKK